MMKKAKPNAKLKSQETQRSSSEFLFVSNAKSDFCTIVSIEFIV